MIGTLTRTQIDLFSKFLNPIPKNPDNTLFRLSFCFRFQNTISENTHYFTSHSRFLVCLLKMGTPGKWLKSLINPKKPTTSDQVTQAFLILCFGFPTLLCFLCFTLFLGCFRRRARRNGSYGGIHQMGLDHPAKVV